MSVKEISERDWRGALAVGLVAITAVLAVLNGEYHLGIDNIITVFSTLTVSAVSWWYKTQS